MSITVDAYRIDIDDRIVLSENLTQANVRQYLAAQGFIGAGGGRFFINGVDTTTEGVDVVRELAAAHGQPPAASTHVDRATGTRPTSRACRRRRSLRPSTRRRRCSIASTC